MADYPRDEFDAVPESSNRQGVHRERIVPARSGGLRLKIAVAVLALLIGLGSYFLLPRLGFPAPGDDAAVPAVSSQAAAPGAEPSEGTSPDAESGESGESETPDAPDAIDREQTVNVLNGTGIPGLATMGADRLAAEGWVETVPGNWAGAPVDSSVVFFNGETQRTDAEAVAADLGILDLIDGADVSPDISVVLGPGFE
jgi:hypothetical protein